MKAAIYARESTDDPNLAPPITRQIELGKAWIQEQGLELEIIYQDDGYSGGDWKRPAWNQSVKDAKRHAWQVLWIWNQDRLARDTEQFLWYYRNLSSSKVRIWDQTAREWIDMTTTGGRVKHQSLAQAAEIFRLVTSDKVKGAYQRKKAKGEAGSWGRPRSCFDLDRAVELKEKGLGWRDIAKTLLQEGKVKARPGQDPVLSYQTVRRYLKGLLCNTASSGDPAVQKLEGDFVT